MNQLSKQIKQIRKAKKLTQKELAFRTGISHKMIGLIERGENSPSAKNIQRICDVLNHSIVFIPTDETT